MDEQYVNLYVLMFRRINPMDRMAKSVLLLENDHFSRNKRQFLRHERNSCVYLEVVKQLITNFMKKGLLIFLVLITSTLTFAQTENKNLNLQLGEMKKYFLEEDYKNFSKYVYPKVIKMMGGLTNMIKKTEEANDKLKNDGYTFTDMSYTNTTKILNKNGEMQYSLIQLITMQTPTGKVVAENTLIAISKDKGLHWTFLDTSDKSKETILKYFPNLHKDIVIRPMTHKNIN
jgi:hypothetical protein